MCSWYCQTIYINVFCSNIPHHTYYICLSQCQLKICSLNWIMVCLLHVWVAAFLKCQTAFNNIIQIPDSFQIANGCTYNITTYEFHGMLSIREDNGIRASKYQKITIDDFQKEVLIKDCWICGLLKGNSWFLMW